MKKDKSIRYVCPKCSKMYKGVKCYQNHCIKKHSGILPYLVKEVLDKRTVDQLFTKIDSLEAKIDVLLEGGIHDINITRIRKVEIVNTTPKCEILNKEVIQELKDIFSAGLNVLKRVEDNVELGIKTNKELKQIKQNYLNKKLELDANEMVLARD